MRKSGSEQYNLLIPLSSAHQSIIVYNSIYFDTVHLLFNNSSSGRSNRHPLPSTRVFPSNRHQYHNLAIIRAVASFDVWSSYSSPLK